MNVTIARVKAGRPAKGLLLVGLRGVGKTGLLNRIEDAAEAERFQSVMVECVDEKRLEALLIPPLRSMLLKLDRMEGFNEAVRRSLRVLQGFISKIKVKYADVVEVSLDVASEDGVADSGDLEADLPPLFVALGQAAATRNVPLALIFDELQYLHRKELGALVMAMHRVADDHDVVRSGLRHIVEAQPNWQVVAEAGNGKDAVQKALETKPDVAVIDYSLPLINGAEATRQIRSAQLRTEVLIFTMHDNETLIQDLLKAGARGYLLKSDARRHLIGAIEALAAHKPFFTAKVSEALLDSFLSRPAPEGSVLTHRERGVVQLVAEGYSNKQIASLLEIGLKTVETHRAAIMRKLNLASTAALVRYAIRNQIVQP